VAVNTRAGHGSRRAPRVRRTKATIRAKKPAKKPARRSRR
jgi:hypothetical protein